MAEPPPPEPTLPPEQRPNVVVVDTELTPSQLRNREKVTGVEVLGARRRAEGAAGDALQFPEPIVPRIPVPKGLAAQAVLADLTGDHRPDVVLWNEDELFVLTTQGAR